MRLPLPSDLGLAIQLYYEKIELNGNDIKLLFGVSSSSTVQRLKKLAREVIAQEGIMMWNPHDVNTVAAYKAWNLDIKDLERRHAKLQKLKGMTKQ